MLWSLSILGLLLVLTACINFINLATAQALRRGKEVGVRKTLGSSRGQLATQFLVETGLITLGSLLLALLLTALLLPLFSNWTKTPLKFYFDAQTVLFLVLLINSVILLAGGYPALVLSGLKPILALGGKLTNQAVGGLSLRQLLVGAQFVIGQLLLIGAIIVTAQMRYIQQADIGFQKENIVLVNLPVGQSSTPQAFKNELRNYPAIKDVSIGFLPPSTPGMYGGPFKFGNRAQEEKFVIRERFADSDYLNTYGLKLIAGRNLTPSDTIKEYIVNEALVRRLGIRDPQQIIGQTMQYYMSAVDQLEGVSCMSHPLTGQLLFYSDGRTVWDRTHQKMPNGQGLSGSQTATQSALIVPFPGKPGVYCLFTVRAFNEPGDAGPQGGLFYSIVDMSLRNGLGDVAPVGKNQLIERYTTEKLTAIPQANRRDYWIITHAWDSDEFLIYALTPNGLSSHQRIAIGTRHQAGPVGGAEAMGYLKASPDGKRLAAAVYGGPRPFELYDFDDQTGLISNYRSLGNYSGQYGVSFSPDNSKLYLTQLAPDEPSYQFDLNETPYRGVILTIPDSLAPTGSNPYPYLGGSLALGIDGRLYASAIETGRLMVINDPNAKGQACQPAYVPLASPQGKILSGLPNGVQSLFNTSPVSSPIPTEEPCGHFITIYPNPITTNHVYIGLDSTSCPRPRLTIYSVQGRVMSTYASLSGNRLSIDTIEWPGGVYLFVFDYGDRKIIRKVAKQ